MRFVVILAFFSAISFVGLTASAETKLFDPSFGLSWDTSPADFASQFTVAEQEVSGDLIILRSSAEDESLPSNTDFLTAIFWNDRLVKFYWASDNFTDDPFGSEGQAAFSTLSANLEKKLGVGEDWTYSGQELWKEPDEFYQCIAYEGCGAWITFWVNPGVANNIAVLELIGLDRGVGYLKYGMEHPNWYIHNDKQEQVDASKF